MFTKLATTKTKRTYVFIGRSETLTVTLSYTWRRPDIKLLNGIHMFDEAGNPYGTITIDIPRVRGMNVGKEIYFCANTQFLGDALVTFLEDNKIAKRTGQFGVSGFYAYPIMQLINTNPREEDYIEQAGDKFDC